MQIWQATIQDEAGNAVPGATVTVRRRSDNALAALFNAAGTSISNPVTAGTDGFVQFRAAAEVYNIIASLGGGSSQTFIWDATVAGFQTRAAAVTACAAGWRATNGVVYDIGGFRYIGQTGATAISDLPGLIPANEVWAEHFPTLQAAVNYLPARGGIINVLTNLFAQTAPTIDVEKGVTWVLHGAGALPAGTNGSVVTSGAHTQPHAGGAGLSSRPGTAVQIFRGEHAVKTGVSNQQDSAFYYEWTQEGPFPDPDTEFAIHRLNGTTTSPDANASFRGSHTTIVGDGGSSKVRGHRTTVIGLDGHNGILVGDMAAATRTGIIPISAGGNGVATYASGDAGPYVNQDAGHVAQVGPGIRHAYRAEGFIGKERPQVVFGQGFGAQALLPENAALQLHGGGNGRIIEVFNDENAGSVISALNRTGDFIAQAFRGNFSTITIGDDAAVQIPLVRTGGFLFVYSPGSTTIWSLSFIRAVTAANANISIAVGSTTDLSTGILTGTTGTDTRCRVSVHDQTFYIENRSGASRNFVWALIG